MKIIFADKLANKWLYTLLLNHFLYFRKISFIYFIFKALLMNKNANFNSLKCNIRE